MWRSRFEANLRIKLFEVAEKITQLASMPQCAQQCSAESSQSCSCESSCELLHFIKLVGDSTDPNVVGALHGVPSHVRQNQLRVLVAYPAYYTYGCQWHPPPAGAGYHAGYCWYASKPIGGTP